MRRWSLIAFWTLMLVRGLAFAIDGLEVNKGVPPATCRILIRDPEGKLLDICSGLLTSKNEVTTAAHCVDGRYNSSMTVQCGFLFSNLGDQLIEKTVAGIEVDTKGPQFQETHRVKETKKHDSYEDHMGNDTAKLTLESESRLTEIQISKPTDLEAEFFETNGRLRLDVKCVIAGFGLREGRAGSGNSAQLPTSIVYRRAQDGKFAILLANIQVTSLERKIIETDLGKTRQLIQSIPHQKRIRSSVISGDSGGPLLCQRHSGWKLVGVTLGARIRNMRSQRGWATFGNLFWNPLEASQMQKAAP